MIALLHLAIYVYERRGQNYEGYVWVRVLVTLSLELSKNTRKIDKAHTRNAKKISANSSPNVDPEELKQLLHVLVVQAADL